MVNRRKVEIKLNQNPSFNVFINNFIITHVRDPSIKVVTCDGNFFCLTKLSFN